MLLEALQKLKEINPTRYEEIINKFLKESESGKLDNYELHITIKADEKFNLEQFKCDCEELCLKPIIIELQNKEGVKVGEDIMTSSRYVCSHSLIYAKSLEKAALLEAKGYNVFRIKIETDENNRLAYHKDNVFKKPLDPNFYYECHIEIETDNEGLSKLEKIAKKYNCHLSKNAFKKLNNGKFINMMTYRNYEKHYEDYKDELETIVNEIKIQGFKVGELDIEYAIFDTNLSHDDDWLSSADTKKELLVIENMSEFVMSVKAIEGVYELCHLMGYDPVLKVVDDLIVHDIFCIDEVDYSKHEILSKLQERQLLKLRDNKKFGLPVEVSPETVFEVMNYKSYQGSIKYYTLYLAAKAVYLSYQMYKKEDQIDINNKDFINDVDKMYVMIEEIPALHYVASELLEKEIKEILERLKR